MHFEIGQGCVVLQARPTGQEGSLPLKEPPLLTTWMARVSCNLLLNKADRQSLLIRLGVDLKTAELVQKRIEKAQTAQAMAAAKSNEEEKLDEEPAEADEDDAPADDEDGSEDEMN